MRGRGKILVPHRARRRSKSDQESVGVLFLGSRGKRWRWRDRTIEQTKVSEHCALTTTEELVTVSKVTEPACEGFEMPQNDLRLQEHDLEQMTSQKSNNYQRSAPAMKQWKWNNRHCSPRSIPEAVPKRTLVGHRHLAKRRRSRPERLIESRLDSKSNR